MDQTAMFGPFFAIMFLTIAVWIYMYVRRIGFINSTQLSPQDLAGIGALARVCLPQ